MDDLIARLEAAKEGSRELDIAIFRAITDKPRIRPPFSTSLDAALTLVPERCPWAVESAGVVELGTVNGPVEGFAATPALALCIACLRARMAGAVSEADAQ